MDCLDDPDDSIRLRALDLISGMVSKKNLVEIVKKMMLHCDESESSSELISPSAVLQLGMTFTIVVCDLTSFRLQG